jgi:hypothetical protein
LCLVCWDDLCHNAPVPRHSASSPSTREGDRDGGAMNSFYGFEPDSDTDTGELWTVTLQFDSVSTRHTLTFLPSTANAAKSTGPLLFFSISSHS